MHPAQVYVRETRSGATYAAWTPSLGTTTSYKLDVDLSVLGHAAEERAALAFSGQLQDEDDLPVRPLQESCEIGGRAPHAADTPISAVGGIHPPEYVAPSKNKKAMRDKARSKARRKSARRAAQKESSVQQSVTERRIKDVTRKRYTQHTDTVGVNMDMHAIGPQPSSAKKTTSPVAATAFVGRKQPSNEDDGLVLTKADAMKHNLRYIVWDGCEPKALLDNSGRICAVLVGSPKDKAGWARVNDEAQSLFEEARISLKLDPKQTTHRRGSYHAVAAGISYGGGQTRVSNLSQSRHNEGILARLLQNPAIQRLAGFGDAAFKLYAPRLHAYYTDTLRQLRDRDPTLRPNFERSAFGAATFNLGPQVATRIHTDYLNLPAGWCAVTAIGRFDPKKGGHLILWDFNLMVEFPPGALVLIPSAIVRHSNTAVGPGETRSSFTQYSAGGLFRWVECGFRSQKEFEQLGGVHTLNGEERWQRGVHMWSTLDELRGP